MSRTEKIAAELAKQSLRPAHPWESGWYVMILVDGASMTVWAK